MDTWITVARLDAVPPGTGKEVVANGMVLAVFNIDGEVHAMDGVCPHAGGPIGDGQLTGCVVTCPWHGWQFDVETGQHTLNSTLHHPTYSARVLRGEIQVRLETVD